MYTILVAGVVIVMIILLLSVITTSKAYSYKHTVDPVDHNPYLKEGKMDEKQEDKQDEKKPHSSE